MSDFFFHLAARSFDLSQRIELVRPRLPSLFESAPQRPYDLEEIFTGSERKEALDNGKRDSHRPADGEGPEQVRLNAEIRKDPLERPVRLPENGKRTPSYPVGAISSTEDKAPPYESDPAVQARGQSGSNGDNLAQSGQSAPEIPISPSPLRSELPGRVVVRQKSSPVSAEPHAGSGKIEHAALLWQQLTQRPEQSPKRAAATPVIVENVEVREGIERSVDHEKPSDKIRQESEVPTKLPHIVPYIGPSIDPAEAFASRRTVSKPEPTVNVTIGRIEVRASVPPPNPPQKPVKQPPVMGLEEYLRRRSKGRDR